ncbi:Deoxycytidylate deaminase, partial [Eschrichtius robustus]|nr:Deoxycytidylate deaminase [Eschrichtius robustus]
MAVAFLSAQRSKDPNSQVGACIVNAENKIVGIGYNGMPNGCSDDLLPWRRTAESILDTKYPYVCHAELNAIMNKNSADVKGCTMYVALFPCNECAKLIIQAGIKEVIFMSDKYHDSKETTAARLMFEMAGVSFRKFTPKCSQIVIDFDSINSRPSQKLQEQFEARMPCAFPRAEGRCVSVDQIEDVQEGSLPSLSLQRALLLSQVWPSDRSSPPPDRSQASSLRLQCWLICCFPTVFFL